MFCTWFKTFIDDLEANNLNWMMEMPIYVMSVAFKFYISVWTLIRQMNEFTSNPKIVAPDICTVSSLH